MNYTMFKSISVFLLALVAATNTQTPSDFQHYHYLHLARTPPHASVRLAHTPARFSSGSGFCEGRSRGYYADVDSGCQAYHLCWRHHLVSTDLCPDGTLFNEQFQVCDHFYNVRCGSPLEDL